MIVAGSANMDIVVRTRRAPRPGETLLGEDYAFYPGGKGANQAVAARRAGAAVAFAGCIGRDAYGDQLIEALTAEGIDLAATRRTWTATGVAFITVEASGENRIIVISGANHAFAPEDVSGLAAPASVLLVQLEIPLQTVLAAASRVRADGGVVIMNASPVAGIAAESRAALLAAADILLVNETEAAALLEVTPDEAGMPWTAEAVRRLAQGRLGAVITLAAAGAAWADRDGAGHVPGHRISAVDTTACGDAFAGAFASAIERKAGISAATAFGNAAGALAALTPGAQPSLPQRNAIETLMASS
jgi:ribokinase